MSLVMWKLEKDLCRCCHAEGSFKHLSDPCFQLGQEEIYSDMLQDCLDIKIVPMTGPLSEVTYTICESCISRLRDAANFKRQVQDCEERFKDMYSKNLIKGFQVKEEPEFEEADGMKQEYQSIGDDDDDESFMKFDDDADADDSLDEQMISVEVEAGSKGKGKGKAKPKPAKKAAPVKKPVAKLKVKPVKMETEELTEAAVSGEKKKGPNTNYALKLEEDGTVTYVCDDCGSGFRKRSHFSQHYRHVHLKLRPKLRACYLCNTKVPGHMRAFHLESVHGWPAPTCGACGRKFAYPFQVLRHQKIDHMGEKSYKCEVCNMQFGSKYRLEQHAIKHTELRKHQCTFCGKAFRWKNNLKTHVMIHLDEKAHACQLCDEAFVQQSSLKYHMSKKHPQSA